MNDYSLSVYVFNGHDPFENLALENTIFRENNNQREVLILWRNRPCVVMGRFQNPWLECDLNKMKDDGVDLVRRQSGGGCVFHDLGNLNYTFISPKSRYNPANNFKIILHALRSLGIDALCNDRNDLVVHLKGHPYKFSGSAFKQSKEMSMHHGTLLIDADLDRLTKYLHIKQKKITSVSVKSVRSKVINLRDIHDGVNPQSLIGAIITAFGNHHCKNTQKINQSSVLLNESHVSDNRFWEWIYGETPKFSLSFERESQCGPLHISISSNKGIILDVCIEMAELHEDVLIELQNELKGRRLFLEAIRETETVFIRKYPMFLSELGELFVAIYAEIRS